MLCLHFEATLSVQSFQVPFCLLLLDIPTGEQDVILLFLIIKAPDLFCFPSVRQLMHKKPTASSYLQNNKCT